MNGHDDIDPRLQRQLRAALDETAADIDSISAARLRAARLRAVDAAGKDRHTGWRWLTLGAPVAAVFALAILVVDAPWRPAAAPIAAAPSEAVRDLDLLTSGENLDLLEDLEFFRWLPSERSS